MALIALLRLVPLRSNWKKANKPNERAGNDSAVFQVKRLRLVVSLSDLRGSACQMVQVFDGAISFI